MVLRVQMLGTPRFVIGDQRGIPLKATIRDQALAYLAYTGDWVSRDRIGFLFWADTPDQVARHNVRQLLKRIRRLDWPTEIEVDGDNIRWLVPTDVGALPSDPAAETMMDVPRSVLSGLGSVLWGLGEIPEAMRLHRELLERARAESRDRNVIIALIDLAFLYGEVGDLDAATETAVEVETLVVGAEFIDLRIAAAQVTGEIWRLSGDHDAATGRVHEGLRLASDIGMPPFALRSLRLHGQLLVDRGKIEKGLGILALVCAWTRRGPDFTAWILDPRVWEECSEGADPELVQTALAWANNQDLADVVARALAHSRMTLADEWSA